METSSRVARLRLLVGADFHTMATLLSRGWSVIAGGLTVALLPFLLSSLDQGYYYTFSSLLGLQILFELGLGQVIMQLVGHDVAHLKYVENQHLLGEEGRLDRLGSLMRLLRRWYVVAALLFVVLGGVCGALFLATRGQLPMHEWVGVWSLLVVCTGINLTYIPSLSFLEGCGRIGQVARLRLMQSVIGYGAVWIALFCDAGLWAACMVPLTATIFTGVWLRYFNGVQRWLLQRPLKSGGNVLHWRRDVLPFQWRIALSALSGYFIFYAFTPLIFAQRGAVEAGRFGIAMAIFNALAAVGTSWVHAKTPTMAMHISRNERKPLNALFDSAFRRSLIFTTVVAFSIVAGVQVLLMLGVPQAHRISDPAVLACLALVSSVNSIIFSMAAYMRAHREEPMLGVSLFGAAATLLIAYFGAAHSILVMSAMYALMTGGVLLPWSAALFFRYRRR